MFWFKLRKTPIVSALVLFDGFYASGAREWDEWHAGVRMHGIRFHYMRYYANGDWISCYRDHPFDFWAFTETVTDDLWALAKRDRAPQVGDCDPSCFAGTFTIDKDILIESFSPDMFGGRTQSWNRKIAERKLTSINDGKKLSYSSSRRDLIKQMRIRDIISNPRVTNYCCLME